MLKGQDVIVLLKLASGSSSWTVRALAGELGLPSAAVHRSLRRLESAGLCDLQRRRVNLSRANEFLVHAVKYLFPPVFKGEVRGVRTAWAASPLRDQLAPQKGLPPVWPDPQGKVRGIALEPLHSAVAEISKHNRELGEQLALIDGLRIGDARVSELAARLLSDRLVANQKQAA